MRTEIRFLLAIGLMLAVLVGTNILFPPVVEEPASAGPDSVQVEPGALPGEPGEPGERATGGGDTLGEAGDRPASGAPGAPGVSGETADATVDTVEPEPPAVAGPPERVVVVEGPLYRYTFSNVGARLLSAELLNFASLRGEGPVQLVPQGAGGALGPRILAADDTLDLRDATFAVEIDGESPPASAGDGGDVRLSLEEGGPAGRVRFVYRDPTSGVELALAYVFEPDSYLVGVEGDLAGVSRPLLVTDLGSGIAFNEADSSAEAGMMAYVVNHLQDGIQSTNLKKVDEAEVRDGPFLWTAFKSRFFVMAILPAREGVVEGDDYLGGVLVEPMEGETRALVSAAQAVANDGTVDYELFIGPQDYARLSALGDDLEEVNPYGWKFFRPIVRPFVGVIMFVLNFLHTTFSLGYGWVLIIFGVLMRVMLWPLNQKAMRAQLRNMAVQPLLKEIQEKHKDNPERLQKEMMKLYKEHGFNPIAGCLPMLLPWPVLIALFFVFQNTIELRGVDFLWLPDLSAKDPLFILPVFLAVSMFLLQYISYKSMDGDNPQMKMMMYIFPLFFGFIFMQFPSGLNLYYATANVATIPQQLIIAEERKKAKAKGPVTPGDDG
jgi:YidC/Oxa1 family membrane protein insertase